MSSKQSNFFSGSNRNKPKLIVSVVFRFVSRNQKHFFRFVSVFRTGIETMETNRIFSKQSEKIFKNRYVFSFRGSSKPLILFLGSNRNKPKLDLFRLLFGLLFRKTKKVFFRFVSMFRTGIETTETNRTYGMGN